MKYLYNLGISIILDLVYPTGIEPVSTIFQTAAMTTSAKGTCLVEAEGVEPF